MKQRNYTYIYVSRLAEIYYGDKYDYSTRKGREDARINFTTSKLDEARLEEAQIKYLAEVKKELEKMMKIVQERTKPKEK